MCPEAMILIIVITICASYVGSSKNETAFNIKDNDIDNNTKATEVSPNKNVIISTTPGYDVLEIKDNNTIGMYNLTTRVEGVRNSYFISLRNNSAIVNDSFINESNQIGNISNQSINTKVEEINTTNYNDNDIKHVDITTVTSTILQKDLPRQVGDKMSHNIKNDELRGLMLEKTKVMLQHHLQLVPMEDKPFDSQMLQSQRYMISILVPVGVGLIGASMIVCTIITLRKVANKRVVHTPLDDDVEVERSFTAHISSISTDTTDKVFLLHTDEI
ncbi:uncharacterized protein LOC132742194 [Ruditapes philippinarum]|uniref:uncharacterized protein LOC132742194 n=1 Tax=Ruditapes philippinarum TaxID=129788 RepID=UPI00295B2F30|nr:uncharacterized protein LOC132742194 [Ruditapes philippinarum]